MRPTGDVSRPLEPPEAQSFMLTFWQSCTLKATFAFLVYAKRSFCSLAVHTSLLRLSAQSIMAKVAQQLSRMALSISLRLLGSHLLSEVSSPAQKREF